MFDHIKLTVNQNLLDCPILNPTGRYYMSTAEQCNKPPESVYNGLKVVHRSNSAVISGSIHKMVHNFNDGDFYYSEFVTAVELLCEDLKLNPKEVQVNCLEFGVNVVLPEQIPVDKFLYNLMTYKGKRIEFGRMNNNAMILNPVYQRYRLKIYDKGRKEQTGTNLLRIEIHVSRMIYLNDLNIHTLNDLLCPLKAFSLIDKLTKVYDQLHLFDWTIDKSNLTATEQEILNDWSNSHTTEYLHKFNRSKYKRDKLKYTELVKRYSVQNPKGQVKECIVQKWSELTNLL